MPAPAPPPNAALTPNQLNEGTDQGLDASTALSICGPAAAVAFARANGRTPSLREAYELVATGRVVPLPETRQGGRPHLTGAKP